MARFALIFALFFAAVSPAAAQEALPETPPELRDFRLDPERAEPSPEPEVTPPPVLPAEPESRPSNAGERPSPAQAERRVPATSRNSSPAVPQSAEPASIEELQPTEAVPVIGPDLPDMATPAEPVATSRERQADAFAWWQIAATTGVAVLALLAFAVGRRRKKDIAVSTVPAGLEHVGTARPDSQTLKPVIPNIPTRRAQLTLEFIPDTATLSFTTLTVKGQLRLVNTGSEPARNLRLRATLMSANRQQEQMIASFYSGTQSTPEETLGDAKAGERIAVQIEMALPVAELQSFEVQNRRLMVPVMAADLTYEWDSGSDSVKLACMVGREARPPTPKMAPLRLDLGPRSFAPLGQRPLYT